MKRASDNLVKAAQKAAFDAQDDQAVVVKSKMVGGIAQVSQKAQMQKSPSQTCGQIYEGKKRWISVSFYSRFAKHI